MAEVLAPQRLDIAAEYSHGFEGMVEQPVSLDDLLKAREDLIKEIVGKMPEQHKRFLVSVEEGRARLDSARPGRRHGPTRGALETGKPRLAPERQLPRG